MTQLLSVVQVGSTSQYTFTWSEIVTPTLSGAESQVLLYSPGSDYWSPLTQLSAAPGNTCIYLNVDADTDCTLAAVLGQPETLTAADPFQVVLPILPVT